MTLRLAFMGTPDFAVPTLAAILKAGHDVAAVYTRPPRKAGRGQKNQLSPIHAFAEENGIEVRTPKSLKSPEEQKAFAALDLDVAVVVAYGLILPKAILDAPTHGCLNLHGSLLPRWRGAAPIQRAIMAGDEETGVMAMAMDEGLDTGDVALTARTPIGTDDTAGSMHDRLSAIGADLMVAALEKLEQGALTFTPQPEEGVTYASKIEKSEGRIDWTRPAKGLHCHLRGLTPWPGAWFEIPSGKDPIRVKVLRAKPVERGGEPGTIIEAPLTIACAEGALEIEEVQRAGRSACSAEAFARGVDLPVGSKVHVP